MEGQLEQRNGRWQLTFVRYLPHPPEKVWRALTEPEHLKAWFPATIEGGRAAGADLRFIHEGPTTDGRMITYDPPSLLEFEWGDEILRFELQPMQGDTELRFVNTFDLLGKAARDAAGWHTCLDQLEYHLDGKVMPWTPSERWKTVQPWYVERFGREASTIGPPESMAEYRT